MQHFRKIAGLVSALAMAFSLPAAAGTPEPATEVELWRLDCGHVTNVDLDMFADDSALQGRRKDLTISCYLIRHGSDYLLWDAGFGTALVGSPVESPPGIVSSLNTTIVDQLQQIGVKPDQIRYVGLSHMHYDHVGQAGSFPKATLLLGEADLKTLRSDLKDPLLQRESLAPWLEGDAPKMAIKGDYDIFGDGSVKMIALSGHTHGHSGLLVRLAETGPVLLSGDLYHVAEQVPLGAVPRFNQDRAKTRASHKRFAEVAGATKATIIIQHEPRDVAKLPEFPKSAR